jgi:hypothetical protein
MFFFGSIGFLVVVAAVIGSGGGMAIICLSVMKHDNKAKRSTLIPRPVFCFKYVFDSKNF